MDDGYRFDAEGNLVLIEELVGKKRTECICHALEDDECICGALNDYYEDENEEEDTMSKPNKVFVLVDVVKYEANNVLGIYSTLKNAQKAADEWPYDNLYVLTIPIDAHPESNCFK
jgi:hypothetical protein